MAREFLSTGLSLPSTEVDILTLLSDGEPELASATHINNDECQYMPCEAARARLSACTASASLLRDTCWMSEAFRISTNGSWREFATTF